MLVFSPDSRHLHYLANSNGKWRVVVDGQPGPAYAGIGTSSLVFSPDGRHVAYTAQQGDKWQVLVEAGPDL